MLLVQVPQQPAVKTGRLVWSSLLPMWLRKHGFVFDMEHQTARSTDFVVAGQEAFASVVAGVYEGPINSAILAGLGLQGRTMVANAVDLYPVASTLGPFDPERFPGLAYGRDILRRIPVQRGERSDPYIWVPQDSRLAPSPVSVQVFDLAPGWHVLAHGRLDGMEEIYPVVISNGSIILLGLPLFDMVLRKHWMPPIEHGYYGLEADPFPVDAELWLARLLRAAGGKAHASPLDVWPGAKQACLTIRFDYDRDIPAESLSSLLDLLDHHGLKASWGFLARLSPTEKMAEIRARGHEIVLHTEAADREGMLREVGHFRDLGLPVSGVTAHGGIGSAGHLGQTYFEWAAEAGLQHADLLSRGTHVPHPAILARSERVELSSVYLPPSHYSLDQGTAPDAHYLVDLLRMIPARLAVGDHVTIMNHPDIHRPELEKLLSLLSLGNVWAATHLQAIQWMNETRFHL